MRNKQHASRQRWASILRLGVGHVAVDDPLSLARGELYLVEMLLTGGCQCGAVRYVLDQQPVNVHICHCRMCQKAVGGPFAIICPVLKPAFHVTRGTISHFRSSDVARRGFCGTCGTPLTFDYPEGDDIGVLVGTLDEPDRAPPERQAGNESRVSWYPGLIQVPGDRPTYIDNPDMLHRISSTNHQHPDHETEFWPPPRAV